MVNCFIFYIFIKLCIKLFPKSKKNKEFAFKVYILAHVKQFPVACESLDILDKVVFFLILTLMLLFLDHYHFERTQQTFDFFFSFD